MPAPTDHRVKLSPEQERRRLVTISQAAEILTISEACFTHNYRHLIKTISPRRRGVALGDVLAIAEGTTA